MVKRSKTKILGSYGLPSLKMFINTKLLIHITILVIARLVRAASNLLVRIFGRPIGFVNRKSAVSSRSERCWMRSRHYDTLRLVCKASRHEGP